jgi:flagellar biosynthesis/type III secretory pathway protein FliH
MQGAVDTVKILSQDPEAVRQAEERQVEVMMYHYAMATAKQSGKAEGITEGKAEGKAEGEAAGLVQGERLLLKRLFMRRFGPMATSIEEKLAAATSEQLEIWADRVLDAATLDDVFIE